MHPKSDARKTNMEGRHFMKRILALFLAVTLLIGVMGTAAVAAELTAKPEIAVPTIKSATIDDDGAVVIVPEGMEFEDGQWGDVEVYNSTYEYGSWYSLRYNAEKKAFVLAYEEDKDDLKGATLDTIELRKDGTSKNETSGSTSVSTSSYTDFYFYYNNDQKAWVISSASENQNTYTNKNGENVKSVYTTKSERYSTDEGYLWSKSTSVSERVYTDKEINETSTSETTQFNKSGTYTGATKTTGEYTYDRNTWSTLKSETNKTYTNKDGKVTSTNKSTATYTYDNKDDINASTKRTTEKTEEGTSNNDYGVLLATTKSSSKEVEKRNEEYGYWEDVETNSETTRLDKNGKTVYSYTESSKDGVTKSEEKSYDEFGNLTSGSNSTSKTLEYHSESYNRFGKTYEETRTYEAGKDSDGNEIRGNLKNTTQIDYNNYKGGENVKSQEYVSEPEYKDGAPRTLQHTTRTSYDKYGSVTSAYTSDESYDATTDEITEKTTAVNYVGKPVEAEMHDKVETIYVRKLAKNDGSGNSTGIIYSGDYTNTTTYYDWDGSVESKRVQSRETTKDENGRNTTTQINLTYSDDGKTVEYGSKQVNGYDKNGYSYYKYENQYSGGGSYTSENWYDEETKTRIYEYTNVDSEGWYNVRRSDKNGTVTTYYDPDKKAYGTYTPNAEQISKNGKLVSSSDKYTDADGKLVYEIRSNYKDGNYTGITYHDGEGKELGFSKSKSGYNDDGTVYTRTESYKQPNFDTLKFALTGAWSEYSYEETRTTGSDGKTTTKSSTTRKDYNKDGILTYEYENKNDNGTYTSSNKEYTEKGALRYAYTSDKDGSVTTYYDNPGNVLSKVINRPADKTKDFTSEKSNRTLITESVNSDTTYYDLEGKLDRQYTDKYTYDYDGDGDTTKVIRTEVYKDATGTAVVTKTTTTDYTDGYKQESETKTKDGTVIGYSRSKTDKDAKTTTSEQLSSDFNRYTGYVFSSTHVKTTRSTEDNNQTYTRTEERKNHDGEVTYSEETNRDKDGNSKTVTKNYKTYEDGSLRQSSEYVSNYDAETKKSTWTNENYRWSGSVRSSSKGESAYDEEKDQTVSKTEYYNSDEELVYTTETTYQEKAVRESDTATVSQTVYTDAKGNEIGYRKVSEDGAVESKTPNTSYSGNLTGAYTLSTTSADGKVTTTKRYDKDGLLTYESSSDDNAFISSEKYYWDGSSTVKTSSESSEDSTGMTTTITANYGEAGDLRSKVETVSGRKSGTHFYTSTEKHYNNAGTLVYTREQVTDYQKDESTDVYKDASGKEIGGRIENEDGSWSQKAPNGTTTRTGELTGFYEYGRDKDGFWYNVSYDKNGKETWRSSSALDDDGNQVASYYENGSETRTYYTVNDGKKSTTYDADGEMLYAESYQSYSDGIAQNSTSYYNQKGELVYTMVEEVSDGYRTHTAYLDADGEVIAEGDVRYDNGDYYDKYPNTTYAHNITGYYETERKGNTTVNRWYDEDNKLLGERARTWSYTMTDDTVTSTEKDGNGKTMQVTVDEKDKDNNEIKSTTTTFSRWNGAVRSTDKVYYNEGFTASKSYDENSNLVTYGWNWDEDDWNYADYYWVNGNQSTYNWRDNLNEQGWYDSWYYATGALAGEQYSDGNGYSYYRNYNEAGKLTYSSETKDGVTNTTWYDADGNITGYDWGATWSSVANKSFSDSTVWDADKVIYTRHSEADPDHEGDITTWKDPAGNVKVMNSEGTTVTFASAGDGWKQAFGNEWYYVEGGKPVTGWKMLGGVWYFFYDSGKMATGLVKDGNSLYAMNKDGAWVASGWNTDGYGNYNYVDASGNAVTGWKQIGGKWYYFTDGWYVREDPQYDSDVGWYQSNAGYMVTGAYDIWNGDWTDTTTYFFNKDGSWDTTPGWKNDGISWFYFAKGGDRAVGWKKIDGEWYYFNAKGVMKNGWVGGNGAWYYLNEDGTMADEEWIQERFEDTWYYADKGGTMATGWRDINNVWYYFNNDGDMASEQWVKSGDAWYYMTESGAMATGWAKDGDNWYYMDEGGAMKTGWVQDGAAWYYLNANGEMVTGQQTIDGVVSNFDASGVWLGYAE